MASDDAVEAVRGEPCKIVREGKRRRTRDGRYVIRARFGMMWVAYRHKQCLRQGCYIHPLGCSCQPIRLPGGHSGEAFLTLKAIQAALRTHYRRRGWVNE